jgi:pimeloyl-ACP methyl ester carboxylesterase
MLRRALVLCALTIWSIGAAARSGDCGRVMKMRIGHASVTSAEIIAAGSAIRTSGRDELPPVKSDFCRVQVTSRPTADSEIRFELWVPSGGSWNGKFEQVGNGGFAGSLPYRLMAHVLALGYAVAGTDDGHRSDEMTDASWALNHPEKIKDYGWRAIHDTAVESKRILRDLTSKSPAKSYFVGCSDGGREALMMAQRYPSYFDGIIAGAPAYTMTRLLTGGALRTVELGGNAAHLTTPQLMLLQSRALQSCGTGGPYLKDPRQCHVEAAALKCTGTETDSCLSEAQIKTAQVMYAERRDPASGRPLYAVLPGAEAIKGSWDAWLTGTDDQGHAAGIGFTWNYLAYMVMHDPRTDIVKVTDTDLIRGERRYASIMDSDDPDLSAFKAHGGKLIQYHGWNDPAIPPGYSLEYRERLTATTGGANDFYRLYMVPGMLHCSGGDAPTNVNWQAALESWVEKSEAPGDLIASDGKGATQILQPFN